MSQSLSGGSQTARELLAAVINGDDAYDLEHHERSRTVAFARLGSPISYQSLKTLSQIEVLPVEIDFADFDRLRGSQAVIASFDVGMVLLHEFAHGILGLRDVSGSSEALGDCETHINRIRRELNLPERQHYIARLTDRQSSNSGQVDPTQSWSFPEPLAPSDQRAASNTRCFSSFGRLRWSVKFAATLPIQGPAPERLPCNRRILPRLQSRVA
jgi:hypothetical protein